MLRRVTLIVPSPQPAAPAGAVRSVFVSYSHRDGPRNGIDLPGRFVQELGLLARGDPSLGIVPESIFFDRAALMAGDDWDDSIMDSLERADLFVFLVSSHSLSSPFCIERELKVAAMRGIPIVPVLLTDCQWEHQPVPGDPRQRLLGAFGAIPKDDGFNACPITLWSDHDSAWKQCMQQLAASLRRGASAANGGARRSAFSIAPLLPYQCDQREVEGDFDRGMGHWGPRALVVLVKGELDDNAPRFWDRLRSKNLLNWIADERHAQLLEPRPLSWPPAMDRLRVRKDIALDVTAALSDALTGSKFRLRTPAALAEWLAGLPGVLPLCTTLPHEPTRALSASLHALLDLFAGTPAGTPLDKLVIAVMVEDPARLDVSDLMRALKLRSDERTHVVELRRLQPVTPGDVLRWHRDHDIARLCELDEMSLVKQVFGDAPQLRLRPFDSRVRPLLRLG